ncbi:MAG: alpha/beta fold hydrolase [Planctomycetota bacterium]
MRVSTVDSFGQPELTPHYDHRPDDLSAMLRHPELIAELRSARRVDGVLTSLAAERYIQVAEQAYAIITDPATAQEERDLVIAEVYNRAVAGVIRNAPPTTDRDLYEIGTAPGAWFDPTFFERYTPAADLRITGMRNHHVTPGLGAPMVAYRATSDDDPADDMFPPEGISWPATAVLAFAPSGPPRLTLYDPRRATQISLPVQAAADTDADSDGTTLSFSPAGEIVLPLAADYTAPYANLLSRTAELASLGFAAMLDPTEAEDRLGIYLLEPYHPDKTPLLLIHGLMSTPLTWIELTNEIQSDSELRDRYQVWHFLYPTATCPYYSAYQLREKLDDLRLTLDPELDDFATQDIVVVGHSMGGILTRTLVSDTGTAAWDIAFRVPPDQLEGEPTSIGFLENVYIYESRPYVNRVVFVATPHRGSDFAANLVGAFGNSLVRLPAYCTRKTVDIARANRDKLQPEYGPWMLNGPPSSIQILRPDSPASRAPDLIPIRDGIHYHSIIGTRTADFDEVEDTSDGIVQYWSSHLEGAASEAYVPSGHNVHDHPIAIAEIKRILREHQPAPALTKQN